MPSYCSADRCTGVRERRPALAYTPRPHASLPTMSVSRERERERECYHARYVCLNRHSRVTGRPSERSALGRTVWGTRASSCKDPGKQKKAGPLGGPVAWRNRLDTFAEATDSASTLKASSSGETGCTRAGCYKRFGATDWASTLKASSSGETGCTRAGWRHTVGNHT